MKADFDLEPIRKTKYYKTLLEKLTKGLKELEPAKKRYLPNGKVK